MPALLKRMSIRPNRSTVPFHRAGDGRVVAHVAGEGEALGPELAAGRGERLEVVARAHA